MTFDFSRVNLDVFGRLVQVARTFLDYKAVQLAKARGMRSHNAVESRLDWPPRPLAAIVHKIEAWGPGIHGLASMKAAGERNRTLIAWFSSGRDC